jgi:putative ATP-dependent endonuclease of OLD family
MWLKKLKIKNFKSIEDSEIVFTPGINVIFGENGTGKTNIVKAILKLLGPTYPGPNSFSKEDYYLFDEGKNITIELIFSDGNGDIVLKWDIDNRGKCRLIKGFSDYVTNEERESLCPLHIPPNREIKDLPGSSKWTPIGRIICKLSELIEANSDVHNNFVRKMQDCSKVLEESPEFSQFKEGIEKYSSEQLGGRGEKIQVRLGLLDHKNILKTLQIFEELQDNLYNLAEGGQGVQSTVTMAALRAFSDISGGSLFIIADEPEAYLHPLAQRSLCKIFEQIAESGTQIILTTHSPHFISSSHIKGINKVWMNEGKTFITRLDIFELLKMKRDRGIADCTVEGTVARLSRVLSVQVREGLFARTVVLCEGDSETMSLDIWAESLGYDMTKDGIAVVPSNGKFSIIDLAELYGALSIPVFLIFDSDSNKSGEALKKHAQHNKWLIEFAGGTPEEFPATIITDTYCVLSPDYETVLRTEDEKYANHESDINAEYGLEQGKQKRYKSQACSFEIQG